MTSANSPTPYRDDLFGPHFATSLFVSEPVHNLVHRMVLEPDGATYRGVRAPGEADREFLASTDNWFRPTQLKTGPDGALWVADMYRAVIEHPEWIPADVQKTIDLRAGSQEGRIYRVFPVDRRPRPIPRLDRLDTAGLVAALDSPNGWQRDTAQRLLMHKNDPRGHRAAAPSGPVDAVGRRPGSRRSGRSSLLDGLDEDDGPGGLTTRIPRFAGTRSGLPRGCSRIRPGSPRPCSSWWTIPTRTSGFSSPCRWGTGTIPGPARPWRRSLRRDPGDPWIRAAVLSSAVPHVATLLAELFAAAMTPPRGASSRWSSLAGSTQDPAVMETVVRAIAEAGGAGGSLRPLAIRGAAGAARGLGPIEAPDRRLTHEKELSAMLDEARRLARDDAAAEPDRILAINLLRFSAAGQAERSRLAGRVCSTPRVPIAVQQAAIRSLGRLGRAHRCPSCLLQGWKTYSPAVRSAVVDILLSRKAWTRRCSSAHRRPPARGRLRSARFTAAPCSTHRDPELRKRAQAVFADQSRSRQTVIDSYKPALAAKGDPVAGKAVFMRVCADVPPAGRCGRRGRSQPRRAEREESRDAADRDPRPQPGLRVALCAASRWRPPTAGCSPA